MDAPRHRPVYLVAPGPLSGALGDAFPVATPLASLDALRPLRGREAGVVVVERDAVPAAEVLALAEEMAKGDEAGWLMAVALPTDGGMEVRPLQVGWPTTPDALALWAASGGVEGAVLELRTVLSRVGRARHDINNPLTSGMAEVQLLLMDAPPEGETREALETIQDQLRRIRDMVADLRTLRHPG